MKKFTIYVSIIVVGLLVLSAGAVVGANQFNRIGCETFNRETGYWVKWIDWNGCYVLLDNQYLVNRADLLPTDHPAIDPALVNPDFTRKDGK